MQKLKATTQKSYYGKAHIYTNGDLVILKSYNTYVISVDLSNGCFNRLWNGWSKTTMAHINDFLRLYGFNAMTKKEWLSLPCESSEPVYNVYMSNGFYVHRSNALLTADECERECEKIAANNGRTMAWYE